MKKTKIRKITFEIPPIYVADLFQSQQIQSQINAQLKKKRKIKRKKK